MNSLITYYKKIERIIGGLKFAVTIIALFAVALAAGTFIESWHGTDYANRLVYKSFWFMGLQFGMFLSILAATLIRLPPKKHLYGFYVIHSGLIILFIGSFITFHSGIDGSLTLEPNLPARNIIVNEDEFRITIPDKNKELKLQLPYVAGPRDLGFSYNEIKIKNYLPFAEDKIKWISDNASMNWSTQYRLFNDDFSETVTFSLHPSSNFQQDFVLGPLRFYYFDPRLEQCFARNTPHGLVIWNTETGQCQTNISDRRMVAIDTPEGKVTFFPDMSPLPLNDKKQFDSVVPYRIFNKNIFEKTPILFLFGEKVLYFDKLKQKWEQSSMAANSVVSLPWMNFKLQMLVHHNDVYPFISPEFLKPQKTDEKNAGRFKAIEVEVDGEKFWVKSTEPFVFEREGKQMVFELGHKSILLPYEITLDNFKMENDPGTKNPASYESFVTVFDGDKGSSKHHIFMNNPLKVDDFTFYQASYFTKANTYGSVLSVNFDPGRPWKYLGSVMLILGSIWHYLIRRKKLTPQ